MHNWLIFQYHRVRANSNMGVLRGCLSRRTDRPRGGKRRRDAGG